MDSTPNRWMWVAPLLLLGVGALAFAWLKVWERDRLEQASRTPPAVTAPDTEGSRPVASPGPVQPTDPDPPSVDPPPAVSPTLANEAPAESSQPVAEGAPPPAESAAPSGETPGVGVTRRDPVRTSLGTQPAASPRPPPGSPAPAGERPTPSDSTFAVVGTGATTLPVAATEPAAEATPGRPDPADAEPDPEPEEEPRRPRGGGSASDASDDDERNGSRPPADPPVAIVELQVFPATPNPGEPLTATLRITGAEDVAHTPFYLHFDPQVLRFDFAEEGGFLSSGGSQTVFIATPSAAGDTVTVGLSALGRGNGASGSGELCRLHFVAVGSGDAALSFSRARVRDSSNRLIPSSYLATRLVVP